MADGDVRHRAGVRHGTQIDGDAGASFVIGVAGLPMGDASASGAKMKPQMRGIWTQIARLRFNRAAQRDRLAEIIIGPKRPVPSANGAVTGRGCPRVMPKRPVYRAAMATSFDHRCVLYLALCFFLHQIAPA